MTVVSNTPLNPYDVETVTGPATQLVQKMSWYPFPEYPTATSVDITWDGDGNPTTFVYKNSLSVALATKTITWAAGLPTNITWS